MTSRSAILRTSSANSSIDGTRVANGQHVVPPGISVLEFFDNGATELAMLGSGQARNFLTEKDALAVFRNFVAALTKKARSSGQRGKKLWVPNKMVAVVLEFRPQFEAKKVDLDLCIFTSECGQYHWFWFEFLDSNSAVTKEYKSPYCVNNFKLVLKGATMIPPEGVAVAELTGFDGLRGTIPADEDLTALLEPKGLMKCYNDLVQDLLVTSKSKTLTFLEEWKTSGVDQVIQENGHAEIFGSRNMELVVCMAAKKWICFIDTTVAPDFVPPEAVSDARRESVAKSTIAAAEAAGIAVEDLVVDGVIQLESTCPEEVASLLEKKDLMDVYPQLDLAISEAQSIRNFVDVWRLAAAGVVPFPILANLKEGMLAKGVKMILCESVGSMGRNHWLEFIDLDVYPNYSNPFDITETASVFTKKEEEVDRKATTIGGGWYTVPLTGVAVEELSGVKKISDQCPHEVESLLVKNGAMPVYDAFINAIVKSKTTRNWADSWSSLEISTILAEYKDQFLSRGLKVVLCKIKPDSGNSLRWFEFIDINEQPGWVPQFDVLSLDGGTVLATNTNSLSFPKGVAVEAIMDRKHVMERVPPPVKAMMENKGCMDLYMAMIAILCECAGSGDEIDATWSKTHMSDITQTIGPKFQAKGVSLFLSVLEEDVNENGQQVKKPFMWVEFVDREMQPNYTAQRGIEMTKLPYTGMTNTEAAFLAGSFALQLGITVALHLL
ncbi:expressed unknown protein [Seminavis robusta]|uniref:Uncharacterized protein n=1 Tax=Seminavis robusta TaxID=568900 RepID=A0A9N8EG73_9STRA|nr:expressed unknown protein [Seminavis robusta]|eukprot:Sro1150_g246630.1 n/a (723) ;mRNA; f:5174-7533